VKETIEVAGGHQLTSASQLQWWVWSRSTVALYTNHLS